MGFFKLHCNPVFKHMFGLFQIAPPNKKDLNMNFVSAKHEFVFLLDIQMSLNLCLDPSKYDE
jgi:hypothetical protein